MSRLSDPYLQLTETNLKKYKAAGKTVADVLDKMIVMCKAGVSISDLCKYGDNQIQIYLDSESSTNVYQYKGVAFPTSVSRNNCVNGYRGPEKLEDGDLIKIELGVHIDGFVAQICYTTLVIDIDNDIGKIETYKLNKHQCQKQLAVLQAATEASKAVFKMMVPGTTNISVVKTIESYAKKYGCSLPTTSNINEYAPGVISYQMSQNVIDGFNDELDEFIHKMILNRNSDTYDFSLREEQFEEDEVWAIDIVMSSGSGSLSCTEDRSTVLKRVYGKRYNLKMNCSKDTFKQITGFFPKDMSNELNNGKFKLGLKECLTHGLVKQYNSMREKKGEYVARIKFTVIVKKDPVLITGRSVDDQIKKLKKIENIIN